MVLLYIITDDFNISIITFHTYRLSTNAWERQFIKSFLRNNLTPLKNQTEISAAHISK